MRERLFTSHFRKKAKLLMPTNVTSLKKILLVEDDPEDVDLTMSTMEENNLANCVSVVSDGAAARDYLFCRGQFKGR